MAIIEPQDKLQEISDRLDDPGEPSPPVQVGVLTRGKPTLGMVLTSLSLQEAVPVRIHVVDTSNEPVINRPDVQYALRLAADRGLYTSYDFIGESSRAFSAGKARLIRELDGPQICLMDDDIVMPSATIASLVGAAQRAGTYGYITPFCCNAPNLSGLAPVPPPFSPGALIYQDSLVRSILLEYYNTTVDILDRQPSEHKVWEIAFLTRLFGALGRPSIRLVNTVLYHLDYQENSTWIDDEPAVIARSAARANGLVKQAREGTLRERKVAAVRYQRPFPRRGNWLRRARQALRLMF